MKNLCIENKLNHKSSRRGFCLLLAVMPCAFASKISKASGDLVASNPEIKQFFTESSKNVGKWIIEQVSLSKSVKLINENDRFIAKLSTLTQAEIGELISDDFGAGRVISICDCNFSVKEATLCVLSASYNGGDA